MGLIQSFLLICLFGGVGDVELNLKNIENYRGVITNWLGMVFLAASDQFCICSFSMILLIPMAFPIYKRELGSRMYTPSPYFFASITANTCTQIFYPIMVSTLTFWFYGYPITTFGGFFCFFLVEASAAMTGLCFGSVIGSFVTTEFAAIMWLF